MACPYPLSEQTGWHLPHVHHLGVFHQMSPLPAWPCPRLQSALLPVVSPSVLWSHVPRVWLQGRAVLGELHLCFGWAAGDPLSAASYPQVPADPAPEPGLPGHHRGLQPEHAVSAPRGECPRGRVAATEAEGSSEVAMVTHQRGLVQIVCGLL